MSFEGVSCAGFVVGDLVRVRPVTGTNGSYDLRVIAAGFVQFKVPAGTIGIVLELSKPDCVLQLLTSEFSMPVWVTATECGWLRGMMKHEPR